MNRLVLGCFEGHLTGLEGHGHLHPEGQDNQRPRRPKSHMWHGECTLLLNHVSAVRWSRFQDRPNAPVYQGIDAVLKDLVANPEAFQEARRFLWTPVWQRGP